MKSLPFRRFKKMYERVLLSPVSSLLIGWAICVGLPVYLFLHFDTFGFINSGQRNALFTTTLAFVIMHYSARQLLVAFPGGRSPTLITAQFLIIYSIVFLPALLTHLNISRLILLASGLLSFIWYHFEYYITRSYLKPKLAVIGGGRADDLLPLPEADARPLEELSLGNIRYDGVVADFNSATPEIERFLAGCALKGVPTYNAATVYESLTGRVKINKMSENTIGSLLPSPNYLIAKTIFDWLIVITTLPFTLIVCVLTALLIRLESAGPIIYTQTRIGQGNKPFKIYKFRSMYYQPENQHEVFAERNDPRITKVGRVIRKLRIDELPQIINVLKNEMSLIGPRPEQKKLVEEFEAEIPFYSYRHVVKPGITGWAQVRQGYAADNSSTRQKIEHDFYYIKHCSLPFDLLIAFLTIRTMLTGFGAR